MSACPGDSPLWMEWRRRQNEAEAQRQAAEVEDVLAVFTKPTTDPAPRVMQLEHDMSIAGHEADCTICQTKEG